MRIALLMLCLGFGGTLFAAEPPVGQSSLKLEQNPVRTARKALDEVNREIATLDTRIQAAEAQASSSRAMAGANAAWIRNLEAQTTALKVQRDQLVLKRIDLEEDIALE